MVALAKLAQHVELDVLCRHAPRDVLSTAMLLQMQKDVTLFKNMFLPKLKVIHDLLFGIITCNCDGI